MRADQLLVSRGLAESRTRARELIEAGAVTAHVGGRNEVLRKPASDLPDDVPLSVADIAALRYVSRGGLKLEAALARSGFDARGAVCLDLGQSTGGFTDCLLQAGAARVVGIDVGHGQLHPRLRGDARVRSFEGINVRALTPALLGDARPAGGFDLIVADLSFISLTLALRGATALARKGGDALAPNSGDAPRQDGADTPTQPSGVLLALVKPQFEVGPGGVDKRGLVRDAALFDGVRQRVQQAAIDAGWQLRDWFDSPIRGGDGNREFFLHATL